MDSPGTPPSTAPASCASVRLLPALLIACVCALALHQFSENSTDPDLFGHVLFGQHMIDSGTIQKSDVYSWTARGEPFHNHECFADWIIGGVHLLGGGTALLLMKVLLGFLTFLLAVRLGGAHLPWPDRAYAWLVGAVAVVELSFGFAARPQIFTALALASELWLLRQIHLGHLRWAWGLPLLFVVWINIHGGALAGAGLLLVAATGTTADCLLRSRTSRTSQSSITPPTCPPPRLVAALWISALASLAALFATPWGIDLLVWLIRSVLWLRPEIAEWNPPALSWNHGAHYFLLLIALLSWLFTRRPRATWEWLVTAAFAVLASRAARNTPLFAIVVLALVPPHAASAMTRLREQLPNVLEYIRLPATRFAACTLLCLLTPGILLATLTLHKERAWTMEIPRRSYPLAAIDFIRQHQLAGNLLVFFDWGDLVIWQLPQCPPSIDGRLDAVYSRALIADHWRLYNGTLDRLEALDLRQADLALLPVNLAGAMALSKELQWKPLYYDEVAVVLARQIDAHPSVRELALPVQGPMGQLNRRDPFPDERAPRPSTH